MSLSQLLLVVLAAEFLTEVAWEYEAGAPLRRAVVFVTRRPECPFCLCFWLSAVLVGLVSVWPAAWAGVPYLAVPGGARLLHDAVNGGSRRVFLAGRDSDRGGSGGDRGEARG